MEKVRRKMIRLQIVSGSVMFISLMAVFGAVVYKAVGPSKTVVTQSVPQNLAVPTGNGPLAVTASLPQGFTIDNVSYSGGDMLFYGKLANGTRKALVFNVAAGRFLADVTVDAQ
ncbi:MAG TPA: hypothetical protein DHE23_22880 [Agrobacterium sp.]|nr:hypothetical protein [Agrobacterium sp.]